MLHIDSLRIAANGLENLAPFQFSVNHGEWVGILGRNGCGKTTLLKSMAGLLPVKSGDLYWRTDSLLRMKQKLRANYLALMMQHNGACGGLNVSDVVSLAACSSCIDQARLAQLLADCSLTHLKDRQLEHLSGGQLQRVMLAQTLFQNTELLLLDEPTNHLDIYHQHQLLSIIKQRANTVIATFHDINLAAQYCDKLLLLVDDKVASFGAPTEVLTQENIRLAYKVDAQIQTGVNGVNVTVVGVFDE
ncbi:ABC transporter ATP-binding protein [Shewanella sp. 1CM18E]|uniref:ABC transporter ATP-binding protein n=1 Tax=Shewanella sp. 1CM18E TaxID=2929169 RepID=UPI0020BEDAAB|nr:ABC transporter ATP-binding protein [Shewanella sp. 1CM18E]MCK8046450.1 ABC transporter ATP-binding protein [Shewanella sp. 1CM18E]